MILGRENERVKEMWLVGRGIEKEETETRER